MTLERLDNGTHVFHPPDRPYIGLQDALGRTAPPGAPSTKPVGAVKVSPPVQVKQHGMTGYELVSFQAQIYDVRGTWQQEGPLDSGSHANFADTSLVGIGPNKARHAFKTNVTPAANGDWVNAASLWTGLTRMITAYFRNKLFFTMGIYDTVTSNPVMYTETSTTDPTPVEVTTFAPHVNQHVAICMAVVVTGGSSYLFIGYDGVNGAGALGCEAFLADTLATPIQVDTEDTHSGVPGSVSGIIQAPNGDVLVASGDGDLKLATNNTVAPGALVFTTMQRRALGQYPVAIGPCALANYAPGALWWCSAQDDIGGLLFANANTNQFVNGLFDNTPKGRLVLSTYDGLTLDPIDFPDLPYVTFATIYRGGVCACDRHAHFWYTGRRMVPMDGGEDRPEDSHKHRLCCGHRVVGDKLVMVEAEVDDRFNVFGPDSRYNTTARLVEFDPYREMTRPLTPKIDLGFGGGSLVVGAAPEFPWSPNTRNLHWFSIWEGLLGIRNQDFGRWWRQYQQNTSSHETERATDLSTVPPGGQEYELEATHTTPWFTHPSLDGYEYTPLRAMSPRVESLQKGGPDAYVDLSIGGYDADGNGKYRLKASEPSVKYPVTQFGEWPSRTWSTALQLVIDSHLSTGYTHWTTNPLPITVEIIARRPLAKAIKL